MREIKFRTWDARIKKYWYWSIEDNAGFPRVPCGGYEQYTGLKDKNGKEIYEGDIDQSGFIVTYCNGMREGYGMNVGFYLQRDDFESWVELSSDPDLEIIGNIHEEES